MLSAGVVRISMILRSQIVLSLHSFSLPIFPAVSHRNISVQDRFGTCDSINMHLFKVFIFSNMLELKLLISI